MPPPVPPPPSNDALNGTVIDPLEQWQPSTPRYGHQQVSGCVLVCKGRSSQQSKEEEAGRSEDEFGYGAGKGGELGVFIRINWLEQMAEKNLKAIVIVLTKWWCDEISVSHLS